MLLYLHSPSNPFSGVVSIFGLLMESRDLWGLGMSLCWWKVRGRLGGLGRRVSIFGDAEFAGGARDVSYYRYFVWVSEWIGFMNLRWSFCVHLTRFWKEWFPPIMAAHAIWRFRDTWNGRTEFQGLTGAQYIVGDINYTILWFPKIQIWGTLLWRKRCGYNRHFKLL